MTDTLKLRLIKYVDDSGKRFSTFVALTDSEFHSFRKKEQTDLSAFSEKIISSIPVNDPTPADRKAAMAAFANRFATLKH